MSKDILLKEILDGKSHILFIEQAFRILTSVVGLDVDTAKKTVSDLRMNNNLESHKQTWSEKLGKGFGQTITNYLIPWTYHANSKTLEDMMTEVRVRKIYSTIDSILDSTEREMKYVFQLHLVLTLALEFKNIEVVTLFQKLHTDFETTLEYWLPQIRAACPTQAVYDNIVPFFYDFPNLLCVEPSYLAFGA